MEHIDTTTTREKIAHGTGSSVINQLFRHGAPILLSLLISWVLWGGHDPGVASTEEAMRHVAWVGVVALLYLAWQARAVLQQPRSGVTHSLVEIIVSMLPLFVAGYAALDWVRGELSLSVFQVIVMTQAALASLIDVVIFTWFSLRLNRLTMTHSITGN